MGAGDTLERPIYGCAHRITFPILDADGDLVTGAANLDSEYSEDSGNFADCNQEAAEIGVNSGMYYLDLIYTEMQGDTIAGIVKTTTAGAKTTPFVLYPRRLPVLRADTAVAGAAASITLDASASLYDNFYNGCFVRISANTGAGQVRRVTNYVGATKVASIAPNWTVNPDNTSTFEVLLDETRSNTTAVRDEIVPDVDRNADLIESQREGHTWQGDLYYVDPVNGDTHANGNRGGRNDPYAGVQDCHDNAVTDSAHDVIILLAGAPAGVTTLTENVTISKRYTLLRGPGRDFIWTRAGAGDTISITADGIELSGFQLETAAVGVGHGIQITDADFIRVHNVWVNATRGDGIQVLRGENIQIVDNWFTDSGQSGAGQGIDIFGTAGSSNNNVIRGNRFHDCQGDAIQISGGTTNNTTIQGNTIEGSTAYGIDIGASSTDAVVADNRLGNNASGDIDDGGTTSVLINNEQWSIGGEVATALTDIDLDHLLAVAHPTGSPVADTIWDLMMNKDALQSFARVSDSLEAIRDTVPLGTAMRGTNNAALAATALSTGVWTLARAGYLDELNIGAETLAHTGNAASFMANVANLALEATLTAMKGAGWTDENLKAIQDAIDALNDFDPAADEVDIGEVKGVAVVGVDDFKADVTNLDQTLSTTESNIRGADGDDLKDISDEIAAIPAAGDATEAKQDTIIADIGAQHDPSVAEIDTELSSSHGPGSWTSAMGAGAKALTIEVIDGDGNAVVGVGVTVKNEAQTANIGTSTTAASGLTQEAWGLEPVTNYKAVIGSNANYVFSNPYSFTTTAGAAAQTVTLTCAATSIPAPSSADVWVLFMYGRDEQGAGVAAGERTVKVIDLQPVTDTTKNYIIESEKNPFTSDADGIISWEVPKTVTRITIEETRTMADDSEEKETYDLVIDETKAVAGRIAVADLL